MRIPTSVTTRRPAVWIAAGVVALFLTVAVGLAVFVLRPSEPADTAAPVSVAPSTAPSTPVDTARSFANLYAIGDTPAACQYTSGQALNTMQGNGLCAGRAEWSTTNIRQSKTCDRTLDGVPKHVFYYETDVLVNRDSGFSVIVEGTGDTWKVTSVGRGGAARQASNGGTLCS